MDDRTIGDRHVAAAIMALPVLTSVTGLGPALLPNPLPGGERGPARRLILLTFPPPACGRGRGRVGS